MSNIYSRSPERRWGLSVVATVAALCLLLAMTTSALANTVHVYDNAGVLNTSQVQSAAASLPYPMDIYTVNTFNGSKTAFQQQTASHTAGNSNLIVMAIDTVHHYVYVSSGSRVPLSSSQATDAADAFASSFSSSGYTGATIAAINSLQNSLRSSSGSNSGSRNVSAPGAGPFGGFGTLCCVGLLILAALALFGFFRRRRTGGGLFGRGPAVPPYNPPYNQPYNQGYPPPNYGPGYGPGYNQGGGIGPLGAGGLGAAAGGFIGYELGKEAGEREAREGQFQGNYGDGGAFGGSGGADFGGGGGADFGGDGGNFGGGADFGGGGGADWGGGSDSGGGGGGSNF